MSNVSHLVESTSMLRTLSSLVTAWLFVLSPAAWAQTIIVVEAKSLQPVPVQRVVEVAEPLVWVKKAESWLQSNIEQGLLPGTYGVQLQNSTGVFFFGPDPAVYIVNPGKPYIVFRGGVWFPASPTGRPRFFAVEEGAPRRGPSLAEAIKAVPAAPPYAPLGLSLLDLWLVEANRGNVVLMQEVPDDAVASKLRTVFGR